MKWSWKIGRVADIDIYIHATFWLLIGWVLLAHLAQNQGLLLALRGVLFIAAIFLCVVLHEFGHALVARRYGVQTRDITLYPIGGVARLQRMPDQPIQELWVALAGPAVNLLIGLALLGWLTLTTTLVPVAALSVVRGPFLQQLLAVNLFIALFNLIPAFPMDGGRVLRALLAMRLEYARATHIAAVVGQGLAMAFGLWGLLRGYPILMFIALFVWIGAAQESSFVQMKSALGGIPLRRAMLTEFRTLDHGDTLGHAIDLLLAGSQQDFPVLEEGRVVGILQRHDLMAALARSGRQTPVTEVMQREFRTADPAEMLETVFGRLQECQCRTMPVTRDGQLVGLVTAENIGEFVMIQAALDHRRGKAPPVLQPSTLAQR